MRQDRRDTNNPPFSSFIHLLFVSRPFRPPSISAASRLVTLTLQPLLLSHEIDGVRKEKERLTAIISLTPFPLLGFFRSSIRLSLRVLRSFLRSSYARVSLRSPTATERVKRVRKRQPKEYDETRRCQGYHIQPIKNSRERNFIITKAVGKRRPIHSRTKDS